MGWTEMTDLRKAALDAGATEYLGGPHFSWEELERFVAAQAQARADKQGA